MHSLAQSHALPSTRVLLQRLNHFTGSRIEQRIQFKIVSITHNLLHKSQPSYLCKLIYIKPTGKTWSSDHLCLSLPPLTSKLKFSDRSFRNASPHLWNSLSTIIRSFSQQIPTPSSPTPLQFNTLSLSRSHFLSRFKTHIFSLSYPLKFTTFLTQLRPSTGQLRTARNTSAHLRIHQHHWFYGAI